MKAAATLALAALVPALAGCGATSRDPHPATNGDSPAPPAGEPTFTPVRDVARTPAAHALRRAAGPARPVVRVAQTPYGRALVDGRGFALYLFTRDRAALSTCAGACAAAWPPYIVPGARHTGADGADTRRLGTTRRHDGRLQLTYQGHPLYYYAGDRLPRQVLCQAVTEFGGTWYVVDQSGRAITRAS